VRNALRAVLKKGQISTPSRPPPPAGHRFCVRGLYHREALRRQSLAGCSAQGSAPSEGLAAVVHGSAQQCRSRAAGCPGPAFDFRRGSRGPGLRIRSDTIYLDLRACHADRCAVVRLPGRKGGRCKVGRGMLGRRRAASANREQQRLSLQRWFLVSLINLAAYAEGVSPSKPFAALCREVLG